MNKNILESSYIPTAELEAAIERFEDTIEATFGDKVESVCHILWSHLDSFSTVKIAEGVTVGYLITPGSVSVASFYSSDRDAIAKAFDAFGVALPDWL